MRRNAYVLHSALPPSAVTEVLRRSIDEKHWTLFSLSGYRGNRSLLGKIEGGTFAIQKRRYRRNDFAGFLFGQFASEHGGTRVEAYFDMPPFAKWFMRVWLAGTLLIGIPIFAQTAIDLATGSHHMSGDTWVGLIVPPLLVFFGTGWPKILYSLGATDRRFILQEVQQMLEAQFEESNSKL